jgi:hypothetical protein
MNEQNNIPEFRNKPYKTYRGFELFNDIEDYELKTRNRAVVLANMAEDHSKNRLISPNGASLILGYFQAIPSDEREDVKNKFSETMSERGFRLTA